MKKIFVNISAILLLFAFSALSPNRNNTIIDNLSIPGPILFEKESYILAWNHSDEKYYKQEYIRVKDSLNKFNKMIFIDVLLTDLSPKDLVDMKTQELDKRKGQDPVINYEVRDNAQTGEYLLDFLISKDDIYEWNAYRYKAITTNKGKAVMLFAYSTRTFKGAEVDFNKFFSLLAKNRGHLISQVAIYKLPLIVIK